MALSCQCPVLLQEGLPQGAMLEHLSFIHRIDKYLLSTYQVPHDVLGVRHSGKLYYGTYGLESVCLGGNGE